MARILILGENIPLAGDITEAAKRALRTPIEVHRCPKEWPARSLLERDRQWSSIVVVRFQMGMYDHAPRLPADLAAYLATRPNPRETGLRLLTLAKELGIQPPRGLLCGYTNAEEERRVREAGGIPVPFNDISDALFVHWRST